MSACRVCGNIRWMMIGVDDDVDDDDGGDGDGGDDDGDDDDYR